MTGPRNTPTHVRLINRSTDDTNGCRLWLGSTLRNGYGNISVDGRLLLAHRVSYETFVGPIPDGMDLDHLCRNRNCITPAHLEPVSRRENLRRGVQRGSLRSADSPTNFPPVERTPDEAERIVVARWLLDKRRVARKDAVAALASIGVTITPQTVSHWRHGHVCPSAANLEALAAAIGTLIATTKAEAAA